MKEGNRAFVFEYTDPVDKSVSKNQGWIFAFADGSRLIFRVSGTSSTGATIRIYFEKYVAPDGDLTNETSHMIKDLSELALTFSNINEVTGRQGPTVIT